MKKIFKICLSLVLFFLLWVVLVNVWEWPELRARMRLSGGNYAGAEEDALRVIAKLPMNIDAYILLSQAKWKMEDYEGALSAINTALEKTSKGNPKTAEAIYLQRCILNNQIQHYRESIEDCTQALELISMVRRQIGRKKGLLWAYKTRGKALSELKKYKEAIIDYNHAIELEPNVAELYNLRSMTKVGLEDYNGAMGDINRAIELEPNTATYYYGRALIKQAEEDYSGAVEDYSQVLKLGTDVPDLITSEIYNIHGWSKILAKDYIGATKDYNHAIELNPNNADAYFGLASVSMKEKKFKSAVVYITHAIELEPSSPGHYFVRGLIKSQLRDYKGAIADYTRSIELNTHPGGIAKAYKKRAEVKRTVGDITGATDDEEKAHQLTDKQ